MKFAIIGGNLLGCATAVYTRRALDANAADRVADGDTTESSDTITIFEKLPQLGGNKFRTLALSNPIPVGTASLADITVAPALDQLLADANLAPARQPPQDWAVFDWQADSYALCAVRSRTLDGLAGSRVVYLLQICAFLSLLFFRNMVKEQGRAAFLKIDEYGHCYTHYPFVLWAVLTFILGVGIAPLRPLLRFYNRLFSNLSPRVISGITYGGRSLSKLSRHFLDTKQQLHAILFHNAATSCITPGHLLSACGLAKYARVSLTEFLAKYNVHTKVLDDFITPSLGATYADTAVTSSDVNALAGLLVLLSRSRVPVALRARARYLDGTETAGLCDGLANAAGAEAKTGIEVTKVMAKDSGWVLSGIAAGEEIDLGVFDAVVLAAVVDPDKFSTDAAENFSTDLALPGPPKQQVNVARYVNLVKGKFRSSYVKKGSVDSVASETTVLNSVNCSEIVRVVDDEWRVVTGEKLEKGSSVADTLFDSVEKVINLERVAKYGCCPPMRTIHGSDIPSFVLGTRFLYAACTDRIANDVNIDVLSARNSASFFRNGVAQWK